MGTFDAAFAAFRKPIDDLDGQLYNTASQLTNAQSEITRQKTELVELDRQLDIVDKEKTELTDKLAKSQSDLIMAEADAAEMEVKLSTNATTIDELKDQVKSIEFDKAQLQSQIATSNSRISSLEIYVNSLEAEIERLTDLLAATTVPDIKTQWGACSANPGGSGLTALQRILSKWATLLDKLVAGRLFVSDGFTSLPTIPDGFSVLHISWKPSVADLIAGRLDADIIAMVNWATNLINTKHIWIVVEAIHEPDVKFRKGTDTIANYVGAKNKFYDVVKSVNADLDVASTLSGWTFNGSIDTEPWAYIKADILGVDLDGIASTTAYFDYTAAMARIAKFADTYGYRIAIPEFGEPRLANDTNGSARATWIKTQTDMLKKYSPEYVMFYDYDTTNPYQLTTSLEIAAWKALIAEN